MRPRFSFVERASRVRRNRDDGDDGNPFLRLAFIWTIVPEDAVSPRGVVWGIRLKHRFSVRARERDELGRIEARMSWIRPEVADGLFDLFTDRGFGRSLFESSQLLVRGRREYDFALHGLVSGVLRKGTAVDALPSG